MIALRKTSAGFGAQMLSVPDPSPVPAGHVRIAVAAAGICGSDLHAFEWSRGYEFMERSMPMTLGHEFAGVVSELGEGVERVSQGERVTCWPTIACGRCDACARGRPQDCQERRIIGLHTDGGFADEVVVPAANCFSVPDILPLELAALTEPLSIAVNIVDVAEAQPGDGVVVLGPGPIGLAAAFVAKIRGCDPVVLVGRDDRLRLDAAREMGIEHYVDIAEEPLAEAVGRIAGRPVDKVVEATGVAASVHDGLDLLRSGGILVVAGIHSSDLEIDLTRFVRSKKQLRAAHDTTERALREAIDLLSNHQDAFSRMITHRFPLRQALEAFDVARRKEAVKVLLVPERAERLEEAA